MGSFGDFTVQCSNGCGQKLTFMSVPDGPRCCAVCRQLGDRSLVVLLKSEKTPERIAAFRAAPSGSVAFARGLRDRGIRDEAYEAVLRKFEEDKGICAT